MRIVSWNMNHCKRSSAARRDAWNYLRYDLRADLAVVQEASPPEGLESVYRPIDPAGYNWGSAVVALSTDFVLRRRTRLALSDCYLKPPRAGELPDSHPGASAVADVFDANGTRLLTAISLYGQWEMMPGGTVMHACARTHRMLSDLTEILASAHRDAVVLAGDLNLTTQGAASHENQASVVFARLRAWRMIDCIARTRASMPRLENCRCPDGAGCCHVRTYRHNNRESSPPTQLDYAFVSKPLASRLERCDVVHKDTAWGLSDHCPIIVDLAAPIARATTRRRRDS
jgi:exonuclease III